MSYESGVMEVNGLKINVIVIEVNGQQFRVMEIMCCMSGVSGLHVRGQRGNVLRIRGDTEKESIG